MFKSEFAQKLRSLLKNSGVRQKDIADKLGLSHASVSQFMHGVSLPRMEQFRTMLDMMNVPPAEAGKLSFQLMMARAGSLMDEERHLSGEPETPVAEDTDENESGEPGLWNYGCNDFFLAEDTKYAISEIPVIMLHDMDVFDFTVPLTTYARNRSKKFIPCNTADLFGTVLILTEGENLALPHCGMLRLQATDKKEHKHSSLELYCFENDTYRIIPNRKNDSGQWEIFFPVPQFDPADVRWRLPLLEVGITPVCEHKNN